MIGRKLTRGAIVTAALAVASCGAEEPLEAPVARSAVCNVETAFMCEEGACEAYEEAAEITYDPSINEVEICSDAVGTCTRSSVRFERVDTASGAARFYRVITTEAGNLTISETGDPPVLGSFIYSGGRLRTLYVLMGQCR